MKTHFLKTEEGKDFATFFTLFCESIVVYTLIVGTLFSSISLSKCDVNSLALLGLLSIAGVLSSMGIYLNRKWESYYRKRYVHVPYYYCKSKRPVFGWLIREKVRGKIQISLLVSTTIINAAIIFILVI